MPLQTISILLPKHQSEAVHSSLHLAQSHWIPPPLSFSLPLIHDRNRARAPPSGPPKFKSPQGRRELRRGGTADGPLLPVRANSSAATPVSSGCRLETTRAEGRARLDTSSASRESEATRVASDRAAAWRGRARRRPRPSARITLTSTRSSRASSAARRGGRPPRRRGPEDARPRSKRRRRAYRLPSDEATIRRRRSLSAASALASAVSGDGGHRSAIPALPPLPPPSCSFPSPCSMSLLAGCFREVSHLPVDRPINHTNSYVYLEKLGCYVATGRIFLNFPRRSLDKKEVICTTLYLTNGQTKTLAIPSIFGGVSQYCSTWYELLCRNTTSVVF